MKWRDISLLRWINAKEAVERSAHLRCETADVEGERTHVTRIITLAMFLACVFAIAASAAEAGTAGMLAKVVLGMFCLLLFLIIDGSPESLGLALFMGFEAMAMAIPAGWFPWTAIGLPHSSAATHFCYQMGDLLKLYFFLMLARVGPTNVIPWLVVTALISVPYGLFREYAATAGINWAHELSRGRDTIVGTVGFVLCTRVWWQIRDRALPWRKSALLLAMAAAFFEVVKSWVAHSDLMSTSQTFRTTFTILEADLGYFYAFSAFLNISTLENRVRELSSSQAKARMIEKEMEIGQIVQKSLLGRPKLPPGIALSCHHEAAVYVSGDTYHAHWDAQNDVFSFLLNDVTGHGVQAALKASACNVLAKTIWDRETGFKATAGDGTRLIEFDRVTRRMLLDMNDTADFNSFIGAEFSMRTGAIVIYRSNFTFPILIEPQGATLQSDTAGPDAHVHWEPHLLSVGNKVLTRRQIKRGSFLIFMSDGLMDSSRDLKGFFTHLRQTLPHTEEVAVTDVNTSVLAYRDILERKIEDDRTLIIFQWLPDAVAAGGDLEGEVAKKKVA